MTTSSIEKITFGLRAACLGAAASFLLALSAQNVVGAEQVGSTIAAESTVSGEGAVGKRVIARADPIYRDERLRANLTGLGEFQLGDGTKLVLGRNASLVIDRYVLSGGGKAKAVTLKLLSGSARFVTGASDKRLHSIEFRNLPAGAYMLRAQVRSSHDVRGSATQELYVTGSGGQ